MPIHPIILPLFSCYVTIRLSCQYEISLLFHSYSRIIPLDSCHSILTITSVYYPIFLSHKNPPLTINPWFLDVPCRDSPPAPGWTSRWGHRVLRAQPCEMPHGLSRWLRGKPQWRSVGRNSEWMGLEHGFIDGFIDDITHYGYITWIYK